jgi:hypothetical protein
MNEPTFSQSTDPVVAPSLPTSTLALVSLITGILSYVALPVIGGIIALITGYMARNETRAVPPTASGDGLATAGIVLGWVNVALAVLGLCLFILIMLLSFGAAFGSMQ